MLQDRAQGAPTPRLQVTKGYFNAFLKVDIWTAPTLPQSWRVSTARRRKPSVLHGEK